MPDGEYKYRPLGTMLEVKTALADCLRSLENGEMKTEKAKVLIYGYSIMSRMIVDHEVEKRMEQLEERMQARLTGHVIEGTVVVTDETQQ